MPTKLTKADLEARAPLWSSFTEGNHGVQRLLEYQPLTLGLADGIDDAALDMRRDLHDGLAVLHVNSRLYANTSRVTRPNLNSTRCMTDC